MSDAIARQPVMYLFHITHKDNIAGILAAGGILCHTSAHDARSPTDISDPEVNRRRGGKFDPIYGKPLHDYVPLYFRARNPMLFRRRSLQRSIVVLYVTGELLYEPGIVYTDGNAASDATSFFVDISDLGGVDWACLNAQYWTDFEDGTRKRCAEVLVPSQVPLSAIIRSVVNNNPLREELLSQQWPTPIDVRPDWFF